MFTLWWRDSIRFSMCHFTCYVQTNTVYHPDFHQNKAKLTYKCWLPCSHTNKWNRKWGRDQYYNNIATQNNKCFDDAMSSNNNGKETINTRCAYNQVIVSIWKNAAFTINHPSWKYSWLITARLVLMVDSPLARKKTIAKSLLSPIPSSSVMANYPASSLMVVVGSK